MQIITLGPASIDSVSCELPHASIQSFDETVSDMIAIFDAGFKSYICYFCLSSPHQYRASELGGSRDELWKFEEPRVMPYRHRILNNDTRIFLSAAVIRRHCSRATAVISQLIKITAKRV